MNEKITVIIPCYNSEKTIVRTLNSIKNQTYHNFEVLIINDGSTDESLKLIKEYCAKNSNFKFFDVPNGGVSNARNIGLKNATGEYIVFIDSDDTVETNYFENIIVDIKGYDMIVYSIKTTRGNKIKKIEHQDEIDDSICKLEFLEQMTSSRLFANVTNKVFVRKKIKDIIFDTTTNLGEDYEFALHYFMNINKYKYYKKTFYNYDLTTGNLGFKNKKNTFELKSKGNLRMLEFYKTNQGNLEVVYKEFVKAFVLDMMILMTEKNVTKEQMKKNQEHCMEIFNLKKIDTSLKNKILIKIYNSDCYILIKFVSYFIKYLNIFIKKLKYGL